MGKYNYQKTKNVHDGHKWDAARRHHAKAPGFQTVVVKP